MVYFNPSLEAPDAVRIRLPDESVLQARVAAISLIDKSGRRTWLANLKASQAELSSDDTTRLWCRDAFDGLRADIRYSYGLGFFEQDVILREQVALPDGMDLGSAKMEIWTEVFDFPKFQLTQKSIQLRTDAALVQSHGDLRDSDSRFTFGHFSIIEGKAYPANILKLSSKDRLPIAKQWKEMENRYFLVETIDYLGLKRNLDGLPMASRMPLGYMAANQSLMPAPIATDTPRASNPKVFISKTPTTVLSEPGVVLDYVLVYDDLININFGGGAKTGGAAVVKTDTDYWNVYYYPYQTYASMPNLLKYNALPSGVSLELWNAPGVWGNQTGDPMFDSYIYPWNASPITVRLSNLPAGRYYLYLYGHGAADNQHGSFTVTDSAGTRNPQVTAVGNLWQKEIYFWQERCHYVVFRMLTVNPSLNTIQIQVNPGISGYAIINGLQLATAYDSDNDGVSDPEEIYIGAYPLIPDTDGDGINDGPEISYPDIPNPDPNNIIPPMDPTNTDTDGDGISDGQDPYPTNPDTNQNNIPDGEETNREPFIFLKSYSLNYERNFNTTPRTIYLPDMVANMTIEKCRSISEYFYRDYHECYTIPIPYNSLMTATSQFSFKSFGSGICYYRSERYGYGSELNVYFGVSRPVLEDLPWEKCTGFATSFYVPYNPADLTGTYTRSAESQIRLFTGSTPWPKTHRWFRIYCDAVDKTDGSTIDYSSYNNPNEPNTVYYGEGFEYYDILLGGKTRNPDNCVFIKYPTNTIQNITPQINNCSWYQYDAGLIGHKVVSMTVSKHPSISTMPDFQTAFDDASEFLAYDYDGVVGNEITDDVSTYVEFNISIANLPSFPSPYNASAFNYITNRLKLEALYYATFSNVKYVSDINIVINRNESWHPLAFSIPFVSGIVTTTNSANVLAHEYGHSAGLEHRGMGAGLGYANPGNTNDITALMHSVDGGGLEVNAFESSIIEAWTPSVWNQ